MPKARRQEIASQGGKAAHAQGRSRQWTSEEARVAGQKGRDAQVRKRPEPSLVDVKALGQALVEAYRDAVQHEQE